MQLYVRKNEMPKPNTFKAGKLKKPPNHFSYLSFSFSRIVSFHPKLFVFYFRLRVIHILNSAQNKFNTLKTLNGCK